MESIRKSLVALRDLVFFHRIFVAIVLAWVYYQAAILLTHFLGDRFPVKVWLLDAHNVFFAYSLLGALTLWLLVLAQSWSDSDDQFSNGVVEKLFLGTLGVLAVIAVAIGIAIPLALLFQWSGFTLLDDSYKVLTGFTIFLLFLLCHKWPREKNVPQINEVHAEVVVAPAETPIAVREEEAQEAVAV